MATTNRKDTSGLSRYQRETTARKRAQVEHVVEELRCSGAQISFRSVASQTGISRSTLYRNPAYREIIERGKESPEQMPSLEELVRLVTLLRSEVEDLRGRTSAVAEIEYACISFR